MIFPEDQQLFTVSELARACGVSRSTLIRIEECGVLTPYRVDPDTGYRYYNAYNAAQVGQYLHLQLLGLTREEIAAFLGVNPRTVKRRYDFPAGRVTKTAIARAVAQ